MEITYLSIDKIYPNPNQPRKDFDDEKMESLASSIERHGIIQPIVVVDDTTGGYMIIAGERRYTAACSVGLKEVPAIIRTMGLQGVDELSLVENIQREDLNAIEEAMAFKRLMDKYGLTQMDISELTGKSRPYIANTVRLLRLSPGVSELIRDGFITGGHGLALLRIEDLDKQLEMAKRFILEETSVREAERITSTLSRKSKGSKGKGKGSKSEDIFIKKAEDELSSLIGSRVRIKKGSSKNKVEIEFYDDKDIDNLIEMLRRL